MNGSVRLTGVCLVVSFLALVGCQVLVIPPPDAVDDGEPTEDMGPVRGPTQVEMTIVLTDGLSGDPLVGAAALLGPQEVMTNDAGAATLLVPAGQVFTAALYLAGHRPLYLNGLAATEDFFWYASSLTEATLSQQVAQAGGVLDPTLGTVSVGVTGAGVGASVDLSSPWVVAFTVDGSGSPSPGADLSSKSEGVVTFANVPTGTTTVTVSAPGQACRVQASGLGDSFSLQVEPGATTSVSFRCDG